jgi:hypothetical protein
VSAKAPRCPLCGRRLRPNQLLAVLGGVPGLTSGPHDHVLIHARCGVNVGVPVVVEP